MTEEDLYAIGMESPTASGLMEELCWRLGFKFPPRMTTKPPKDENLKEFADPFGDDDDQKE